MTDPISLVYTIGTGAGAGLLYGTFWFAHKHHKNGESLNRPKFVGTLLVASFIGASIALSGEPVTRATWLEVFAKNLALVTLLEPILKSAFSEVGWFPNYAGTPAKRDGGDTPPR